jgi:hypothetical protein
MFHAWAEHSFEPELYITETNTPNGKPRKRTRGKEYETFVADFVNVPALK